MQKHGIDQKAGRIVSHGGAAYDHSEFDANAEAKAEASPSEA